MPSIKELRAEKLLNDAIDHAIREEGGYVSKEIPIDINRFKEALKEKGYKVVRIK